MNATASLVLLFPLSFDVSLATIAGIATSRRCRKLLVDYPSATQICDFPTAFLGTRAPLPRETYGTLLKPNHESGPLCCL